MSKGGDYEREVSKQLSLWITEGKRNDIIWRTSASGGRATQRAKKDLQTAYAYGDLTFTDPVAKPLFELAVVEVKRGYTNTSRKIKKSDLESVIRKIKNKKCTVTDGCKLVQRTFSKAKKGGGVDVLDIIDNDKKGKLPVIEFIEQARNDSIKAKVSFFWLILRRDSRQAIIALPLLMVKKLEKIKRVTYTTKHLVIDIGPMNIRYLVTSLDNWLEWLSFEDVKALRKATLASNRKRVRVRI